MVIVLVAELIAICLLRRDVTYQSLTAPDMLAIGAGAACAVAFIQIVAAGPAAWRELVTRTGLLRWGPYVAYATAVTASARLAPAGQYPNVVAEAWWFGGLAIATAQICKPAYARRFTLGILIAALAVLMLGVLGPKSAPDLSGRFLRYSGVLHWGAYPEIGMLALLGAAAALAILLSARTWTLRFAAAVLAGVFGVVLVAVNSRGAVLALAATAAWLVAVAVAKPQRVIEILRGRRRAAWLLIGAVCVGVAIGGALVYRSRLAPVAQADGPQASAAMSSRVEDWRVAVRMIAAHPLLGVGPGRYPLDYARYSSAPPQPHAHNMLLHVAAEAGLLGLIPFAVLWGRLLWLTLRASGAGAAGGRDAFVLHALLVAFFIRGMMDQFLSGVHSSFRTTLLMAIVLGLAEASAAARAERRPAPVSHTVRV
jgi:O-antigen ligase